MIRLFEKCPACGGQIVITECKCANCRLEMRGEFGLGPFNRLSDDQLTFVQVFLRTRGNLSEVEKVLGVSYPTIRNKLDEVNDTLNRADGAGAASVPSETTNALETAATPADEDRRAILLQVAAGKLSAAEAATKLQELKRGQ